MNKTGRFLFFSFLILLTSCSYYEVDFPEEEIHELVAVLEGHEETRTHLSGPEGGIYYPCWSGDEEIAVYIDGSPIPQRFAFVSGKDARQGTFAGPGIGDQYVALYPFSARKEYDDENLTISLPSEQSYTPGSFSEDAFPMLAVSGSNTLSFKNLCAVLKVSLTGKTNVLSVSFTANDPSRSVSGEGTISMKEADDPVLVMAESKSPSVRLVCEGVPLSDSPTDFFLVVPPGPYPGGFTLKIKTPEGSIVKIVDRDILFKRSEIRAIPAFECIGAELDPEDLPENIILYRTASGRKLGFEENVIGGECRSLSDKYENGWGKIVCDSPVKAINYYCFADRDITEIKLPPSVETIGQRSFQNVLLEEFAVPEGIRSIELEAFTGCTHLKRFKGPYVTEDGKSIIMNNAILAHIVDNKEILSIPEGVVTANPGSFLYYGDSREKVRGIVFPEGFTLISYNNFNYLPNLEYVTLSSTSQLQWSHTFEYCPRLREFRGNSSWIKGNGRCLVDQQGYLIGYAGFGITDFVIPEGVLYISGSVFSGYESLYSVTLPESILDVWNQPFEGADNLSFIYGKYASPDAHSVVINGEVVAVAPVEEYVSPPGATKIGWALFGDRVKKIKLNDCVMETDAYAFYSASNLETLILSSSMKEISYYCFNPNKALKDVYFRSPTPPACGPLMDGSGQFSNDLVVHVPEESLEAYRNAPQWSFFAPYFQGYMVDDLPPFDSDGNVVTLQKATEGQGIDLVLMGDAFIQDQIEDGTYGSVMRKMLNAFFSVEPYQSYRNYFNVYQVDVVSERKGYGGNGQKLGTWFGEGTKVGGNDATCLSYARKAVGNDRMDNVLVLVAMDTTAYAGTCYMTHSSAYQGDWGEGPSVAYFPLGKTDEILAQLVHHEAGGHGFAKLADEYGYESQGAVTQEKINETHSLESYGWWKNVDFTSDPAKVKWSYFLKDDRYRNEGLGVYEGGLTYWTGVWRPTRNSIMLDNTGGFNAPSREAIWYRLHKLAYGKNWQYNYEDFVAYDAVNRKKSGSAPSLVPQELLPPLAEPVVIHKSWKELLNDK